MNTSSERGWTLVELLVVMVLGTLVMGAALQVLITNQRAYSAQTSQILGQQTTRAAMDVLSGELREISPASGDIVAMAADSLRVRVMREYGVTCTVTTTGTPTLTVVEAGDGFATGDSVFVFADNDPDIGTDDAWFPAVVSSVQGSQTCGTLAASNLLFSGYAAAFAANIVVEGAPVRGYGLFTYGVFTSSGESYLGRREGGAAMLPLIGPIDPSTGLSLRYLDSDGAATATPADVRMIEISVRSQSGARDSQGNLIYDDLTTRVYTRN